MLDVQGGETASTESAAAVVSEQNRPARSVCTFCSVPSCLTCCVIMQPWRRMLMAVCNDTMGHFEFVLHHGSMRADRVADEKGGGKGKFQLLPALLSRRSRPAGCKQRGLTLSTLLRLDLVTHVVC